MERLNLDTNTVDALRAEMQSNYPAYEKPCPASALQVDDDVMWIDIFPIRILWGHDHPDFFNGYCPEYFGDVTCNLDGHYVTDRAPANPNETPMPVWPQQAQQPQRRKHDAKEALRHLLAQLKPDAKKRAREIIRQKRPELLGDKDE